MIIEVNIGGQMLMQKEPKWKRCLINLFPIVEWGTPFWTWPNWIESRCPCAYFHAVFDLHSLWGHYWLNRPSTPQAKFLAFAVIGLRVFFFYHFCVRKQVGFGKSWLWRNHGLDSRSFVLFAFRNCFPTQMFTSFRI